MTMICWYAKKRADLNEIPPTVLVQLTTVEDCKLSQIYWIEEDDTSLEGLRPAEDGQAVETFRPRRRILPSSGPITGQERITGEIDKTLRLVWREACY